MGPCTKSRGIAFGGTRVRELALQPFDPQPRHGRGLPAALPLADHCFGGGADVVGQLLLTDAKKAPEAHECG